MYLSNAVQKYFLVITKSNILGKLSLLNIYNYFYQICHVSKDKDLFCLTRKLSKSYIDPFPFNTSVV